LGKESEVLREVGLSASIIAIYDLLEAVIAVCGALNFPE
jgi:hypothetical protein